MAGVSPVRTWNEENGGCRFYYVVGALAAPAAAATARAPSRTIPRSTRMPTFEVFFVEICY